MKPRVPRPYLVLACHPERDSLWLEWPNALGARWCSRALRDAGWVVLVLRGLPPTEPASGVYRCEVRAQGPALAIGGETLYS